jgi:hypothetical protein
MLDVAAIQNNLNLVYAPKISSQINNLTPALAMIPKSMEFDGQKIIAWDVQVALNPGGGSMAAGADIALSGNEYALEVPATLPWKYVQVPFQVAGPALAIAAKGGPAAYANLFGKQMSDAALALARKLGTMTFADGTGNGGLDPSGFLAAIGATTGSYAGISRTSYTVWAPYVSGNAGTPRNLTKSILDTAETNIFLKSGFMFDFIVTTPAIAQAYETLFTNSAVPIVRTEANQGVYGMGATDLYYKGKPVYRDPNCPAGALFMLSKNSWAMQMLNPVANAEGVQLTNGTRGLSTQSGDLGVQVAIEMLGKTGDAYKGFAKVYYNLQCTNPNWNAYIYDLQ